MRIPILGLLSVSLVVAANAQSSAAPSAKQLVGAWSFVLNETTNADGTKVNTYGPHPIGILIFDPTGNFSLFIANPERPKFASSSRLQATPDECKSAVSNSISYFGKYSVDDAGKNLVLELVGCSFPNWDGIVQKRPFTIEGDELRFTVPVASGGGSALVVLKRVK